jgi:CRP/FNR family cyclic AMP-dependent transcriptional regulator
VNVPMPTTTAHRRSVHLLDVDPELASRLRDDDRLEAREQLRAPLADVPVGEWSLQTADTLGRPMGIMVVDGVLLQEVRLGGRRALQILGPGDLVLPKASLGDGLDANVHWTAAVESQVAVLDDRLQRPFALWPGLALGFIERAGQQLARLALQAAIAQLPRVDQRLEATFWQLADRWGRVTPSGIHIPLALTHEVLARLVGGRRPTITLALTELAERGVLVRHPDRTWMIIARTSTLPSADRESQPAPLDLRAGLEERFAPARPMTPRWSPDAAQELMTNVRELRRSATERRRQFDDDLARYAETRERSQQLRALLAEHRAHDAGGGDLRDFQRR